MDMGQIGTDGSTSRIKRKEIARNEEQEEEEIVSPWVIPRKEPFSKTNRYNSETRAQDPENRPITGKWDADDTKYLSKFDNVDVIPTRFTCEETLKYNGFLDDVASFFEKVGFGSLYCLNHHTYPKEVKEFLATVRLTYSDPVKPSFEEDNLTFFYHKRHYSMTVYELFYVFNFPHGKEIKFPSKFEASDLSATQFWDVIGSGGYTSRGVKESRIRNSVLRYIMKVMSNTLFAKAETGAVKYYELWIAYHGVKHLLGHSDGDAEGPVHDVNLDVVLAEMLIKCRITLGLPRARKEVHIGTIVTPILIATGINISRAKAIEEQPTIDEKHLIDGRILKNKLYKHPRSMSSVTAMEPTFSMHYPILP